MPVVDLKYSNNSGEQQVPTLTPINGGIFTEIKELLDKITSCQLEEKENRKKSEKLKQNIKSSEEVVIKAEAKRAALLKKAEHLKTSLRNVEERSNQALDYWKKYGLDVRQASTDSDPFEQYEFIFTKLSKHNQGTTSGEGSPKYSINIRFSDQKLNIVSQEPEVMKSDQLQELKDRLNNNCVNIINDTAVVDYRSAMVMIRKDLTKSVSLLSKTC